MDLPEKCTIWNVVSNDGFGGVTWSDPVIANCRIAKRSQQFTDSNGDQLMSTALLYTDSVALKSNSQVLLFIESAAIIPPSEADDVRQISEVPSGTDLKKAWFS